MTGASRSSSDHSAAHEALVREAIVALSQIPGVLVLKLTQWAGETNRGTHIRAGMRKGAMDLCVCAMGRTIWLDAKTGDATLTAEQEQFQRLVREHGGVAEPVRSVDQARAVVLRVIAEAELQAPALVQRVRAAQTSRTRLAELEQARTTKIAARKSNCNNAPLQRLAP